MAWRKYGIWSAVGAFLCAGVAIVAGCAAERQVLTTGASLSADTLRAGGLAVLGVTVIDEVEQIRPPLVAALESTLVKSRPDLPFLNANAVRDSLGLAAYRRILFAYQSTGKLAPEDLAELNGRLGPTRRFGLLARVEKNAVRISGQLPQQQSPYAISMRAPPTASRDARVRVTVFDLKDRYVAWEGVYASSSDNAGSDSLTNPPRRIRFEAPGGSADTGESIPDQNPEAPSLAEALLEGFRALAGDLPGATPAATAPAKKAPAPPGRAP